MDTHGGLIGSITFRKRYNEAQHLLLLSLLLLLLLFLFFFIANFISLQINEELKDEEGEHMFMLAEATDPVAG